ncbi:MAG: TlpA family protein disulfide reductase [Fimbriimonadaceae bacterium]|nr:TlpA family protein disulfide reductase [Fimbriimonadaceae bacterium]
MLGASLLFASMLRAEPAASPDDLQKQVNEIRTAAPRTAEGRREADAKVRALLDAELPKVVVAQVLTEQALGYARLFAAWTRHAEAVQLARKAWTTDAPKLPIALVGIPAAYQVKDHQSAWFFAVGVKPTIPNEVSTMTMIYSAYLADDAFSYNGYQETLDMLTGWSTVVAGVADTAEGYTVAQQTLARIWQAKSDLHGAAGDAAASLKALKDGMAAVALPAAKRGLEASYTQANVVGKPAPGLEVTHTFGNFTSLEALRGKVVILDFFAHWCGPCKASFPDLRDMYADLKGRGIEIVHATRLYGSFGAERDLTPEQELQKMTGFVKDNGLVWPVVYVSADDYKDYGVSGIPHIVLIDAEGKVVRHKIGYSPATFAEFRKQVEGLLAAAGR